MTCKIICINFNVYVFPTYSKKILQRLRPAQIFQLVKLKYVQIISFSLKKNPANIKKAIYLHINCHNTYI